MIGITRGCRAFWLTCDNVSITRLSSEPSSEGRDPAMRLLLTSSSDSPLTWGGAFNQRGAY
eukprot:1186556-Prorocentrum_minimum.AAC.3